MCVVYSETIIGHKIDMDIINNNYIILQLQQEQSPLLKGWGACDPFAPLFLLPCLLLLWLLIAMQNLT